MHLYLHVDRTAPLVARRPDQFEIQNQHRASTSASTGSIWNSNSKITIDRSWLLEYFDRSWLLEYWSRVVMHLYLLVDRTAPLLARRPDQFEIQIQNQHRTSTSASTGSVWNSNSKIMHDRSIVIAWVLISVRYDVLEYCSRDRDCLSIDLRTIYRSYDATSLSIVLVIAIAWVLIRTIDHSYDTMALSIVLMIAIPWVLIRTIDHLYDTVALSIVFVIVIAIAWLLK